MRFAFVLFFLSTLALGGKALADDPVAKDETVRFKEKEEKVFADSIGRIVSSGRNAERSFEKNPKLKGILSSWCEEHVWVNLDTPLGQDDIDRARARIEADALSGPDGPYLGLERKYHEYFYVYCLKVSIDRSQYNAIPRLATLYVLNPDFTNELVVDVATAAILYLGKNNPDYLSKLKAELRRFIMYHDLPRPEEFVRWEFAWKRYIDLLT